MPNRLASATMSAMAGDEGRKAGRALASTVFVLALAGFAYRFGIDARAREMGRADLVNDVSEAVVYGAALISAATVGLVVAVRQRRHPVGWLFLVLALWLSIGAAGDGYALDHAVLHAERGDGAVLALVAGQASWIAWFGLLAAILHLTPTGRPLSRRWGTALSATFVAAAVALAGKIVQDSEFEPPFEGQRNPWAMPSIGALVDPLIALAITLTMLGLIVGGVSLVVRFRRARGEERQQLRWLTILAAPLPPLVVASYVGAATDLDLLRTAATGSFVTLIPVAAGLSVQRYRLYDVDHILSRATAYALSSLCLAALFAAVTAGVGRTLASFVDDAVVPAVLATVVTVTAAAPLHRRLQDVVDRRFDRRRYDAHRLVAEHLGAVSPPRSLEATLAAALHDSSLSVAYWLPADRRWVTAAGQPATLEPGDIEVSRNGELVARVRIDREQADARLAGELATEVVAELDNVRLRADVATQLEEVRQSRARIVAAEAAERHRIERNLHDGAQQRLLGLAMQLRAVQIEFGPEDTPGRMALDRAVREIGAAVRDLRDLANGLRPAILADGGLPAALDDLAGRAPLPVDLDVPLVRLPPVVEETLWFVACEALANTIKHAAAGRVHIQLVADSSTARLIVSDDGTGGAHILGQGLRGIADRTEAVGGSLRLHSPPGTGTTIEAEVPCAS
jgi:signal transduction histidine kinase